MVNAWLRHVRDYSKANPHCNDLMRKASISYRGLATTTVYSLYRNRYTWRGDVPATVLAAPSSSDQTLFDCIFVEKLKGKWNLHVRNGKCSVCTARKSELVLAKIKTPPNPSEVAMLVQKARSCKKYCPVMNKD